MVKNNLENIIEEISLRNDFLEQCRVKDLTNSLKYTERDVTAKYLQMAIQLVYENNVHLLRSNLNIKNTDQLIESYSTMFSVDRNFLKEALSDQHMFCNRWVYRSFMEFSKEVLEFSDNKFYSEIAKMSILNAKYDIIAVSKFFDLGTVLKSMGKQTKSNWTELTNIISEENWFQRGEIKIRRSTIKTHIEEMREMFDFDTVNKLLKHDCILTSSAYQNLFTLFSDKKAKLHQHTNCEAEENSECVYTIDYTPIPLYQILWRGLLYSIPAVKKMTKENEELKSQVFNLEDVISRKTERVESLVERLKTIQKISLSGTKHSTINRVRRLYLGIEENLVENLVEHFNLLYNCSKNNNCIKELLSEIGNKLEIYTITESDFNKIKFEREIEGIIDPNKKPIRYINNNQEENNFLAAFNQIFEKDKADKKGENNFDRVNDIIKNYGVIKNNFMDRYASYLNITETNLIEKNPFIYLRLLNDASDITEDIIESFEKDKKRLEEIIYEVNVKETVNYAIKEAEQNRNKSVELNYQQDKCSEYIKTNPTLFQIVIRDIIGNSIDAGATTINTYFGIVDEIDICYNEFKYCLKIADNGSGMSIEKLKTINEFLTSNASEHNFSSKKYGGEGTKILKDFIKLHNARAEYFLDDGSAGVKLYFQ